MSAREDRARQLREEALALIAQADAAEAEPEPEEEVQEGEIDLETLLAEMELYGTREEQALVGWEVVQATWDDFDGNETLRLVGGILDRLFTAVDEPVDEPPTDAEIAAHVRGQRFDPRVAALLGGQAFGEAPAPVQQPVINAEALRAYAEEQEPEQPAPQLRSRLAPRHAAQDEDRPPPGMKRRTAPRIEPQVQTDGAFAGPLSRGDDPRLAAARAQAARQMPVVAPLKSGAPRKASGHNIAPHLQQWKRDAAGRRVPIETPEDPE